MLAYFCHLSQIAWHKVSLFMRKFGLTHLSIINLGSISNKRHYTTNYNNIWYLHKKCNGYYDWCSDFNWCILIQHMQELQHMPPSILMSLPWLMLQKSFNIYYKQSYLKDWFDSNIISLELFSFSKKSLLGVLIIVYFVWKTLVAYGE